VSLIIPSELHNNGSPLRDSDMGRKMFRTTIVVSLLLFVLALSAVVIVTGGD
jgi:hypothetical protein